MTEANELALPQNLPLVNQNYDDKTLEQVASNSEWLPRLQVMGGSSELVKAGKATMGTFALVFSKDKFVQLDKEIDVLVVSWRPMALRTTGATPLSYFNVKSEAFQEVKRIADSGEKDTGCMYGPQFLVWIPSQNTFATFFASGKSARREAPNVVGIIKPEGATEYKPAMATLKIVFVPKSERNKNSWHTFACVKCSTPPSTMPDNEKFVDEVTKFNNPVDSKIEVAQAPAGGEQRAR